MNQRLGQTLNHWSYKTLFVHWTDWDQQNWLLNSFRLNMPGKHAICFVICGRTEYLGSLWGREGVEVCWTSRLVSLYSVIQTLWCTQYGSRPWTRDFPGLRSSPHATSVLGRSLPLTIRWTMAIPASPLPQTLKMAAYLASVGLKTVLVSSIRNLTLSVNLQLLVHVTSDPNLFSRLLLFMLHCTPSQC